MSQCDLAVGSIAMMTLSATLLGACWEVCCCLPKHCAYSPRIALHDCHSIADVVELYIALECDDLVLIPFDSVEMLRVRLYEQRKCVVANPCTTSALLTKHFFRKALCHSQTRLLLRLLLIVRVRYGLWNASVLVH